MIVGEMARYSGQLVDRIGDVPLADYTVRMLTDSSFQEVFEPGEIRTGDVARASLMNGNRAVSRPSDRPVSSVVERLEAATEIADLMGMRVLVIAAREDAESTKMVCQKLRDLDAAASKGGYVPLMFTGEQAGELPKAW